MHLTRSGVHIIARFRGDIIPKYQHQFKALKEEKEVSMNRRVSNRDMFQTVVNYDAEVISKYFLLRKRIKVSVYSSAESNWFGHPIEENI